MLFDYFVINRPNQKFSEGNTVCYIITVIYYENYLHCHLTMLCWPVYSLNSKTMQFMSAFGSYLG